MISVVVRKSLKGLLGYFEGDFGSQMWFDDSGERLFEPSIGGLLAGKAAVDPWHLLTCETFKSLLAEIDRKRKSDGILAVELGFAPPKSVSLAALADVALSRDIITAHRAAVDETLAFCSQLILARAKGKLVGCGVQLMEFLHPWTRAEDPQLHSHILVLRDHNYTHALWTTPLFLIQRAMREAYHYSLCARLRRAGYGVLIDAPGSLAWELDRIPWKVIEEFSKRSKALKEMAALSPRGFFSQGAEFRVAGWASRRVLPKTDPSVSLADARKSWVGSFPPLQLGGVGRWVETGEIDLSHVFRRSSIVTREQFVASHLRWWLGSTKPLAEAVALADQILRQHVSRCRVLHSERSYCLPEALATEGEILSAVAAGFEGGEDLKFRGKRLPPPARRILDSRHAVKIISTYGERAPLAKELLEGSGTKFSGLIRCLKFWDASTALELIQKRNSQPLLIFVEEPLWLGDYGARLGRFLTAGPTKKLLQDKPFRFQNRKLVVVKKVSSAQEEEKTKPGFLRRAMHALVAFMGGNKQKTKEVVFDPTLSIDAIRRLNWQRFEGATGPDGINVNFLRPASWKTLLEGKWEGLGVFAARRAVNAPQFIRQGQLWLFTGPPANGKIELRGIKREKSIAMADLQAVIETKNPHLALVEPIEIPLIPGIPLMSPVRLESNHQVFRQNEVQILTKIEPNGCLRFGKRFWPGEHILLEPAFYVREFSKQQPLLPIITVNVDVFPKLEDLLSSLPPAGVTCLQSKEPEAVLRKLERDLWHKGGAKRTALCARAQSGERVDDLALLFPSPAAWKQLEVETETSVGRTESSLDSNQSIRTPSVDALGIDTHEVTEEVPTSASPAQAVITKKTEEQNNEKVKPDHAKTKPAAPSVGRKKKTPPRNKKVKKEKEQDGPEME